MFKYDLSVIIPVYNSEEYVEESIKSIINQKYDFSKIQVILINDGSTDNSKEICEKFSKKYSNVILINQKNAGVSEARNNGIKKAEGKYILFLDSDDTLSKNTVELLIKFFNKHYDEVDLVTYPMTIYENEKAKPTKHYRYSFYTNGTGVYDLVENPYLGQSTINTIIKNLKADNVLFNKEMNYSEDEAFNTEVLMKKKKIGFCKEATYIYRKNVGSVTKNKSNPYYTFESLIKYNEKLIEKFKDDEGRIPSYIQAIILNNIRWRIKRDEIFPYHYEEKEYENAINRIKNVLQYIENSIILNMPAMPIYHKFYIFKMKGINLGVTHTNKSFTIVSNGEELMSSSTMEIAFSRFKIIENKKLYMLGCVKSPICEILKPQVFLKYKTKNGEQKTEELILEESVKSHYQSNIKTNTFYKFEKIINLDEVQEFEFFETVNKTNLKAKHFFSNVCILNTNYNRYSVLSKDKKHIISYIPEKNVFEIEDKPNIIQKIALNLKNTVIHNKANVKSNIYRLLAMFYKKKNVWLYYDANNVYDNGYYQFLHDFKIKDGIKRYYVYDGQKDVAENKFSKEERKNLLVFGSLKHKMYYLSAEKIITSDISLGIYCPFGKSIGLYKDIANYDLIYLQHGILYASLLSMYAKENKEIDKIVISSEFEKENLIKNYKYNEQDLIKAGMPRFDIDGNKENEVESNNANKKDKEAKRIIYAPSWRKYLVGDLIKRKRIANMPEMLKSNFYNKNVELLTSNRLKKILEESNVILEFKLHPNFNCYKEIFEDKCSKNIILSENEVSPKEYDMLITDYSSFQFDFIKHNIPITYFVPDPKEFKAGLHTYRKLDLPLEEAFGDVVYTSENLINKIEYYIKNNFIPEEKYKNKMENFFYKTKNCRDKIYEEIKN